MERERRRRCDDLVRSAKARSSSADLPGQTPESLRASTWAPRYYVGSTSQRNAPVRMKRRYGPLASLSGVAPASRFARGLLSGCGIHRDRDHFRTRHRQTSRGTGVDIKQQMRDNLKHPVALSSSRQIRPSRTQIHPNETRKHDPRPRWYPGSGRARVVSLY